MSITQGEDGKYTKTLVGKPEGTNSLKDLGTKGEIILK
jgi:hypothetical protein